VDAVAAGGDKNARAFVRLVGKVAASAYIGVETVDLALMGDELARAD
jgi:hypothetical protein